ncbi:hypothetical protein AB0P10_12855 [Streptomyces parvus]
MRVVVLSAFFYLERQRELAAGLDLLLRGQREAVDDQASGTDMTRDT